jgi:hypothetical protein
MNLISVGNGRFCFAKHFARLNAKIYMQLENATMIYRVIVIVVLKLVIIVLLL